MDSAAPADAAQGPRDAQGPKPFKNHRSPSDERRERRKAALHNARKRRKKLAWSIGLEDDQHRFGLRDLVDVSTLGDRAAEIDQIDREIRQLLWEKKIGWTGEPGHGPRVGVQPQPSRKGEGPRELIQMHVVRANGENAACRGR